MAYRKRPAGRSSERPLFSGASASSGNDTAPAKKAKRQVAVSTFEKWQRNFDREHQTLTWLKCDTDKEDKDLVSLLWCSACREYKNKICSMKNYSQAWVTGSTNHRTSNVLDHVASDQHKAAMSHLRTVQARANKQPVTSYAPIARSLMMLEESEKGRMRRKFDMCYFMAKEGIAFEKYAALLDLEARHDVDLGSACKTAPSAKLFTHYIAESQRQQFLHVLSNAKFCSFLMDGSTDAGNVEQEVVVLLSCKKDDAAEEIKSYARFFSVGTPEKADASGLVMCLSQCLSPLGIADILDQDSVLGAEEKPVLVGGGTDGASVNVAQQNGMRGILQSAHPWLVWSWCYAHRLELACKNALTSKLFKGVEEMLLRLYYLYEKSPKKTRELEEIVEDLKQVFELPKGGDKPVRAQGSRWITHKRKALQRVVDRYGAYISHLTALAEDTALKAEDRARLRGYLKKWTQYRIILGCALYVDILKPPSLLSLSLQGSELDTVLGIKNILKSTAALKNLAKQDPLQWPTVKLFLGRIKEDGGQKTYQGAALTNHSPAVQETSKQGALQDLTKLDEKMKERLKWSDIKLLRCLLVFLDTQTWVKRSHAPATDTDSDNENDADEDCSLADIKESVEHIATHFRLPLEAKGVSLATLQDEVEEVVDYARKYLDIGQTEYRKVWYKLYSCPDAPKWPNILSLCELSFSLPFSNGRVEQIFSSLKVLKTTRRTNMQRDTLNDLLEIYVEGPALSSFCPDHAIELWWSDCNTTRRVNQQPRKAYRPRNPESSDPEPTQEEERLTLDLWDEWFLASGSEDEPDN